MTPPTPLEKAMGGRIRAGGPFPVAYPIVFWPLFALFMVYYLTSMFLFYFFAVKRSDRSLIERSLYLTSLETGFGMLFGVNAFLRTALPQYPCFLDVWVVYIGHISWSLVVTLIMIRYYMLAKSHQVLAAGIREVPVTPDNLDRHLKRLMAIYKGNSWPCENDKNSDSYSQSKEASTEAVSAAVDQAGCQAQACIQEEPLEVLDSEIRTQPPAIVDISRQRSVDSIQEIAPFADIPSSTLFASRPHQQSLYGQPTAPDAEPKQVQSEIAICVGEQQQQQQKQKQKQRKGKRRWLSLKIFGRAETLQKLKSRRFISCIIAVELAVVAVLLGFLTIFSRQMSLHRVKFNCSRGWEYYIVMSTALLFSIVICPLFLLKTRRLKDKYGIKASLAVSSVAGALSWIGGMVWRSIHPLADYYISTSLFFLLQIIAVHSCIVAYPVVKSIIFARKQCAGIQDTERVREYGRVWALDVPQTEYDLSKQSFLCALRDSSEHQKIQTFAMSCFCSELIYFLDVYVALKRSIYLIIRQNNPSASTLTPALAAGKQPSCQFPSASLDNQTLLPIPAYRPQTPENVQTGRNLQLCKNNTIEESSQNTNVPLLRRLSIMLTSTFTRKSGSDAELPSPVNHVVETEELQNLSNLSVGITQAMQQAFPGLLVSERTVLPESLRNTANIIIKTFMLPDSPLAINAPSDIVATCKAYLTGGQLTFGMLDRAKDEVIDMLYCNVYLRYRK